MCMCEKREIYSSSALCRNSYILTREELFCCHRLEVKGQLRVTALICEACMLTFSVVLIWTLSLPSMLEMALRIRVTFLSTFFSAFFSGVLSVLFWTQASGSSRYEGAVRVLPAVDPIGDAQNNAEQGSLLA